MKNQSVVDILSHVELFKEINADDIQLFAELAEEQQFIAGDILFHASEQTNALYVIASGSIQLVDTSQKTEQSLTVFSRYEFIGETILVAPVHQQGFTARVYADATLYRFERTSLLALLHDQRSHVRPGQSAAGEHLP